MEFEGTETSRLSSPLFRYAAHGDNRSDSVKAYALEPYQNTLVMYLEDFGGKSLATLKLMAKTAEERYQKARGLKHLVD
ncbi:MAG TPA: hypothetical protein V6C90_11445 [Coleofasciculaceae cyanobacterium]